MKSEVGVSAIFPALINCRDAVRRESRALSPNREEKCPFVNTFGCAQRSYYIIVVKRIGCFVLDIEERLPCHDVSDVGFYSGTVGASHFPVKTVGGSPQSEIGGEIPIQAIVAGHVVRVARNSRFHNAHTRHRAVYRSTANTFH